MEKFINSQQGISYSVSTNCSPGVACNNFVGIITTKPLQSSSTKFHYYYVILVIFIIILLIYLKNKK